MVSHSSEFNVVDQNVRHRVCWTKAEGFVYVLSVKCLIIVEETAGISVDWRDLKRRERSIT